MDNLRVFSTFNQQNTSIKKSGGKKLGKSKRKEPPPRKNYSRSEILKKLEERKTGGKKSLKKPPIYGKDLGESFMKMEKVEDKYYLLADVDISLDKYIKIEEK